MSARSEHVPHLVAQSKHSPSAVSYALRPHLDTQWPSCVRSIPGWQAVQKCALPSHVAQLASQSAHVRFSVLYQPGRHSLRQAPLSKNGVPSEQPKHAVDCEPLQRLHDGWQGWQCAFPSISSTKVSAIGQRSRHWLPMKNGLGEVALQLRQSSLAGPVHVPHVGAHETHTVPLAHAPTNVHVARHWCGM